MPSPWERPEAPGLFTVLESATRVGHYKWYAMGIFELLGTWVAMLRPPAVQATLGAHCAEWAFAAEIFQRRLGTVDGRTAEDWTVPPSAGHEAWLGHVGDPGLFDGEPEPADSALTVAALAGGYRVLLPRMAAELRLHRNWSAVHSDAPTIRAIELVQRDVENQVIVGEMMLQQLLQSSAEVDIAAARVAALESELVALGGLLGPGD